MVEYSASLRVLIVDDEPLIRWSLAEILSDAGHVTIEAADGEAAIRAVSQSVDVILLDYRLPDSNDLTLLSTLRRLAPDSGIVIMTAHDTPDIVREALRLGAHRVLAKPFELRDLAAIVARAQSCRPI
jgi:two-component system response regulator (stage 0 sporulation protein F)